MRISDWSSDVCSSDLALWLAAFPWRRASSHKYQAGQLLVAGGSAMTGAAQLVCRAGLRIGAGLVSVACDAASLPVYAVANPAVITLELPTPADFAAALEEPRRDRKSTRLNSSH